MVEKFKDGTFVPQELYDILVEAIGTKEHGGCVCDFGRGVDLRIFFGLSSKSNKVLRKKEIEEIVDQGVGYRI